jgi:DNA-binding transcriptional ArsR family regulator
MTDHFIDSQLAKIAAAIAEPARTRMLCALMDDRARTSTELAMIAEVSTSTASVHLTKLVGQNLLKVVAQGKHRYYQLAHPQVAATLESLMVLAGYTPSEFIPNTPSHLRRARTCYDHMAGEIAVALHDYLVQHDWIRTSTQDNQYLITALGEQHLHDLGMDLHVLRNSRRQLACACLDWSERRSHLGGALGAMILKFCIQHAWLERELDGRALHLSSKGKRQFLKVFKISL